MYLPERDGDGYLVGSSLWTPDIARAMAEADGVPGSSGSIWPVVGCALHGLSRHSDE